MCVFVQQHRATPWLSVLNNWWLHPSLSLLLRQAPALFLCTRILLSFLPLHRCSESITHLRLCWWGSRGAVGDLNHVEWTFLTGQQNNDCSSVMMIFPNQRGTSDFRAAGDTLTATGQILKYGIVKLSVSTVTYCEYHCKTFSPLLYCVCCLSVLYKMYSFIHPMLMDKVN